MPSRPGRGVLASRWLNGSGSITNSRRRAPPIVACRHSLGPGCRWWLRRGQVVPAGDQQGVPTFGQYFAFDHVGEECVAFAWRGQLVASAALRTSPRIDWRIAEKDTDPLVRGEPTVDRPHGTEELSYTGASQ